MSQAPGPREPAQAAHPIRGGIAPTATNTSITIFRDRGDRTDGTDPRVQNAHTLHGGVDRGVENKIG
jgi:hypothetical protein